MLVSMNSKRLWDLAKGYAKANNKYILVIDNVKWFTLSNTKKATVKTYYDGAGTGSIPQDEVGEIFNTNDDHYTFYEFDGQGVAVDTAADWFPKTTDIAANANIDDDYFIHCFVITPAGGVPYTNKIPPKVT